MTEVLPNGNLMVSGEKQIGINQGVEYMRFSGMVDPRAIQTGNTVPSTQVADARIEYRGNGQHRRGAGHGLAGALLPERDAVLSCSESGASADARAMTTTLADRLPPRAARPGRAAASAALCWPAPAQAERLKDLASIQGVRSNQLIGYGLVVGLDGTGDQTTQTPFTAQSLTACCSSWA